MTKCAHCSRKIAVFETRWKWVGEKKAMCNECHEKYMNESPEKQEQWLAEGKGEKQTFEDVERRKQKLQHKGPEFSNLGIIIRIIGLLSAFICFIAGMNMVSLRSVSGTSVAEAYYQAVGVLVIGLSLFIVAFLWGLAYLMDKK